MPLDGADPGLDEGGLGETPAEGGSPWGGGGVWNAIPAFSGAIWSGLIALKSPPFLC